jgi:hypothetical protein
MLQNLLESAGIPFVGTSSAAAQSAFDKVAFSSSAATFCKSCEIYYELVESKEDKTFYSSLSCIRRWQYSSICSLR